MLGPDWQRLPPAVRRAHEVDDLETFTGEANVETGGGALGWLVARLFGFPPAGAARRVTVSMERRGEHERWTRRFDRWQFASVLSPGHGPRRIVERFGPIRFHLRLPADETGLTMPIERATLLGLSLPSWLMPESRTREFVDPQGRFSFDVEIRLPLVGRLLRYRGWLRPLHSAP